MTGLRLLTLAPTSREISEAAAGGIAFTLIALEAFSAGAPEQSMPPEIVAFLAYLFVEALDDRNAAFVCGVQRALGANHGISAGSRAQCRSAEVGCDGQ
ncbi:hypothetical protein I7860_18930 [Pseudomonas tolaasii]|uniref:hypothetical protein n=1 Tax=Pseudomonas tolaasii TaxID=29442 RepID=UPI001C57C25C|nr:hypothetical protein [Pseudomonas tolaasii]MBW1248764.1 hypothetical protein [Pseudomonas tolaasii]